MPPPRAALEAITCLTILRQRRNESRSTFRASSCNDASALKAEHGRLNEHRYVTS